MKYIASLILSVLVLPVLAAEVNTNKPIGLELSAEPYGMVSWTRIAGEAELGAGINTTLAIGRGLTLVAFGEGDHEEGLLVERLGAGLRYTAYLGKYVSLDGGVAGAYDLEDPHFFIRLPLGANFTFVRTKNIDFSLRAQYAFDISGNRSSRGSSRSGWKDSDCKPKHTSSGGGSGPSNDGVATGRLFVGPVLSLKF